MSPQLLSEARELVLAGEASEGLALALRLTEQGEPEALALAVQVLGQLGRVEEAAERCQAFAAEHPELARAWELCGDVAALGGRLEDALAAYARASEASGADPARLACSAASALLRAGRHAEARAQLDAVPSDSPYLVRAAMLRLQSCNRAGEPQLGLDYVRQALAGRPLSAPPAELAWLLVEEGHARLALGEREAATTCGLRAAALDRGNPGALFVIREARGERSPDAWRYRLQVVGGDGSTRFTAPYEVVAAEPSEALELCRALEPGIEELTLVAFERGEAAPELPKGVYARGGRSPLE